MLKFSTLLLGLKKQFKHKLTFLYLAVIFSAMSHSESLNQNQPTFNHIAICVHNLKKSTEFYTTVFQFPVIKDPFNDNMHQWLSIGPNLQLHIIQGNCQATHVMTNHLCFSVNSLQDYIKHLDTLHIRYSNFAGETKAIQVRPDGVRQIYFHDPDGYWIEVNDAK